MLRRCSCHGNWDAYQLAISTNINTGSPSWHGHSDVSMLGQSKLSRINYRGWTVLGNRCITRTPVMLMPFVVCLQMGRASWSGREEEGRSPACPWCQYIPHWMPGDSGMLFLLLVAKHPELRPHVGPTAQTTVCIYGHSVPTVSYYAASSFMLQTLSSGCSQSVILWLLSLLTNDLMLLLFGRPNMNEMGWHYIHHVSVLSLLNILSNEPFPAL